MRKMFVQSLVALSLVTGCVNTASPTVAPNFTAVNGSNFVTAAGALTPLSRYDYSQQPGTAAISVQDPIIPDAAPALAGSVVFAFDQKLVGSTIETPVTAGTVGQGDWSGKFNVITGFTPQPNVVAYEIDTSPGTVVGNPNTTAGFVTPSYRPEGAWPIDPASKIWDFPPTAIRVRPNGGAFPTGAIVVIHLLANVVRGVSGELLGPATNASGQPITVTLSDGTVAPVAASVVVQFP